MAWTVILRNNSGSAVEIVDLGLELPDSSVRNVSDTFTNTQLLNSADLKILITAGTLTVNDGNNDLTPIDGTNYVFPENIFHTSQTYAEKGDFSDHGSLTGRNNPDQHMISATTGLTEALTDVEYTTNKGVSGGYATLDSSGLILYEELPQIAVTSTFVVASEVEQLALDAQEGDVAVRTDENKSYIHIGGIVGDMTDWQELLTPTDTVLSVNGFVGAVVIAASDISSTDGTVQSDVDALSAAISPSLDHTVLLDSGGTVVVNASTGNLVTESGSHLKCLGDHVDGYSLYVDDSNGLGSGTAGIFSAASTIFPNIQINRLSNGISVNMYDTGSAAANTFHCTHSTTAKTGDFMYARMANGSGTFTGNFLDFWNSTDNVFTVGPNGEIISTTVDSLSGAIDTNITNIDTNATDVVSLSGAIDTNATNISNNTISISGNSTDIATNLVLHNNDSAFLSGAIDTNITNIATLSGSHTTDTSFLSGAIDTNTTDIVSLSGAIDSVDGLMYWTESENTAAPNNVTPVVSWTPSNVTTSVDVALTPKGTGAIVANIPDSVATGGNKRGIYAVDFQRSRTIASQAATGQYSFIGGGRENAAGGTNSTVAGGRLCRAGGTGAFTGGGHQAIANTNYSVCCGGYYNQVSTGDYSFIGGGNSHVISDQYGVIVGGYDSSISTGGDYSFIGGGSNHLNKGSYGFIGGGKYNKALADYSFVGGGGGATTDLGNEALAINSTVVGGKNNVTSGTYSFIGGGEDNTISATGDYSIACGKNAIASVYGSMAHSSGAFTLGEGNVQGGRYILRGIDGDGGGTVILTTDQLAASTNNQIVVVDNQSISFLGTVTARLSGAHTASWKVEGLITRDVGAATTTLVESTTTVISNVQGWTLTLAADTTNGALSITFAATSTPGTDFGVGAVIDTSELTFA